MWKLARLGEANGLSSRFETNSLEKIAFDPAVGDPLRYQATSSWLLARLTPMSVPFPEINWLALSPGGVLAVLFTLRAADMTLSTLRMLAIVRGRATAAWFLGFFGATLFILGAAGLLANLARPLSIVAYAAGFATGTAAGFFKFVKNDWIEQVAPDNRKVGRRVRWCWFFNDI